MTSEQLSATAGLILSLAFSYVPMLREKFEPLSGVQKRAVMAVLILIVACSSFALACGGVLRSAGVTCDQPGALGMVSAFIAALVANQATYLISPQPKQIGGRM